jgi:hypothetical protein
MPLEKLSSVYGVEKVTHKLLSGKLSVYEMINVYESKPIRQFWTHLFFKRTTCDFKSSVNLNLDLFLRQKQFQYYSFYVKKIQQKKKHDQA